MTALSSMPPRHDTLVLSGLLEARVATVRTARQIKEKVTKGFPDMRYTNECVTLKTDMPMDR